MGEPRLSASLGRPSGVNVWDNLGFLEVRPSPGKDGESRFNGRLTPDGSVFRDWLPDDSFESGFEPANPKAEKQVSNSNLYNTVSNYQVSVTVQGTLHFTGSPR